MIGVALDSGQVGWGLCQPAPDDGLAANLKPYRQAEALATIQKTALPALNGRSLSDLKNLAASLDALVETVQVTKALPPAEPEPAPKRFARRALLTGALGHGSSEAPTLPVFETIEVAQAIHPAIRQGLSQALLAAIALERREPLTAWLARAYGYPDPSAAVPLQMPILRGTMFQLAEAVVALRYTVSGANFERELGSQVERLQRFVRQLSQGITGATSKTLRPILHLDMHGGLQALFNDNLGLMLGVIYGLEEAAHPCLLRVQDPILSADIQHTARLTRNLKDLLDKRGISVQLVAGAGLHSPADVAIYADSKAVDAVSLHASRLGSFAALAETIAICRQAELAVYLDGSPAAAIAQLALAFQVDEVIASAQPPVQASVAALQNEMSRTLAELKFHRLR